MPYMAFTLYHINIFEIKFLIGPFYSENSNIIFSII